MNIKTIPIDDLKPAKYNPRKDLKPGDSDYEHLKRSIDHWGLVDPLIVNQNMVVVGGHQRLKVLRDLGYDEVECVMVDLDEANERALNIALNKISGDWDLELLESEIVILQDMDFDIDLTGFDDIELGELFSELGEMADGEDAAEVASVKLVDKFIIPPFSVFDTRQGYWQERKRAWLGLGIKGEEGRGDSADRKAEAGNLRDAGTAQKQYAKTYGTEGNISSDWTGTSIFDPVLCEIAYRWFCPEGGAILDPFAGSLPIRVGKQFGSYRKLGKMHQNVLVFYKGDPKQIKANYGEILVEMLEDDSQQL